MAFALVVGLLAGWAPLPAESQTLPDTADVHQAVEEALEREGVPGAGAALVTADSVVWAGEWGWADQQEETAVDPATTFRAGDAGTTLLSLVLLRLSEEGALALDDPVAERVPDASPMNPWQDASPLRLVHLMEHTGGLSELALGTLAQPAGAGELADVLADDPRIQELRWPPGRQMARSRAGPALAARAVEHLAGEPFPEVARSAVLEPLGMEGAQYEALEGAPERLATGYRGGRRALEPRGVAVPAVQGLQATPRDLARLPQLFLGRGTVEDLELLTAGSVDWAEEPSTGLAAQAGLGGGYAFGVEASVDHGFIFLGHEGSVDGFFASWGYLPDAGVGYAFMANADGDGARAIHSEVRRQLVDGLEPPEPESQAVVPEGDLRHLTGRYEGITSTRDALDPLHRLTGMLRLRLSDEPEADLALRGGGEAQGAWVATAGQRFRPLDEPVSRLAFQTDEAGRQLLVGTGPDLEGSYAPVPAWSFWTRWGVAGLVVVGILSALGFAAYWIPVWARGRLPHGERVSVRGLPAAASGSLVVALLIPWLAGDQLAARLGTVSLWSLGFMALTVAFAVLSVVGLVQAIRARDEWCSPGVRTHARAVSVANLLALLYLAAFGLIGTPPWTF